MHLSAYMLHLHIRTHARTYEHTCTPTRTLSHVRTHTLARTHTHARTFAHVRTYTCARTRAHAHARTCRSPRTCLLRVFTFRATHLTPGSRGNTLPGGRRSWRGQKPTLVTVIAAGSLADCPLRAPCPGSEAAGTRARKQAPSPPGKAGRNAGPTGDISGVTDARTHWRTDAATPYGRTRRLRGRASADWRAVMCVLRHTLNRNHVQSTIYLHLPSPEHPLGSRPIVHHLSGYTGHTVSTEDYMCMHHQRHLKYFRWLWYYIQIIVVLYIIHNIMYMYVHQTYII